MFRTTLSSPLSLFQSQFPSPRVFPCYGAPARRLGPSPHGAAGSSGPAFSAGTAHAGCRAGAGQRPHRTYAHPALDEPPANPFCKTTLHVLLQEVFGSTVPQPLQVPAPCAHSPPTPGADFFPILHYRRGSQMRNMDPSCSARTVLTNPNSFLPVPSVAVTDGCCEQWGVVVGNNQNGSTRLRGHTGVPSPCLDDSARAQRWDPPLPGLAGSSSSPTGCLRAGKRGLQQQFNL